MSRLPWRRGAELTEAHDRLGARVAQLEHELADAQRAAEGAQRRVQKAEGRADKLQKLVTKLEEEPVPAPHVIEMGYAGARIRLEIASGWAGRRANAAEKEPFTVEWIESLPAGAVLYDVGANVGAFSLIAARRPQGALRVVAIEPGFASFATLCANIVLNDAVAAITPLPLVLGDATALREFRYRDLMAGSALHAGLLESDEAVAYTQPVLAFRLDDLVERFDLPAPEHVKLDVDGAETLVLQGAQRTLASPALRSLLVEVGAEEEAPVEALLTGSGFARTADYARGDDNPSYRVYGRA